MTRIGKIWSSVLTGRRSVPFRDFERLLAAFGFVLDRVSGSHHIYVHPRCDRPLSIQPRGHEAKPYQVRQFIEMIERFGLTLGEEP